MLHYFPGLALPNRWFPARHMRQVRGSVFDVSSGNVTSEGTELPAGLASAAVRLKSPVLRRLSCNST